jgi:hypothetical protein
MTKEQVFRLWALETMVSIQGAALHNATPDPQASLARLRKKLTKAIQGQGFPGLDATVSDFASAELEAALDRLLSQQQGYLAVLGTPSE